VPPLVATLPTPCRSRRTSMVRRWPRAPVPWTRSVGRDRQRRGPTPCWSGALGRSCNMGGCITKVHLSTPASPRGACAWTRTTARRGWTTGRPRARPGDRAAGRADGWTRLAICRSRAPGGSRARLGGRAATWAHITACRGGTAGGPRARPEGRAAAWNRIALWR
jgi:hypothetical protein